MTVWITNAIQARDPSCRFIVFRRVRATVLWWWVIDWSSRYFTHGARLQSAWHFREWRPEMSPNHWKSHYTQHISNLPNRGDFCPNTFPAWCRKDIKSVEFILICHYLRFARIKVIKWHFYLNYCNKWRSKCIFLKQFLKSRTLMSMN